MKVKAKEMGYYGDRRYKPDVVLKGGGIETFEIPDLPAYPADHKDKEKAGKPVAFSARWMEPVDGFPVVKAPAPVAPKAPAPPPKK